MIMIIVVTEKEIVVKKCHEIRQRAGIQQQNDTEVLILAVNSIACSYISLQSNVQGFGRVRIGEVLREHRI